MKKLILLLLIFTSCKSIEFTALSFQESNTSKLPTLSLEIDDYSLLNAFSVSSTSGSYSGNATTRYSGSSSRSQYGGTYNDVTTLDPRVQDTKTLFKKETYTNICSEIGEPLGYIKYEIPLVEKNRSALGYVLSACALFVPSLLGVPQVVYNIKVEVTSSIYDKNHNLISSYSSFGNGKEKAKLYGYHPTDARRLASAEAVKMAFEQNRKKILADMENISRKLKNS